MGKVSHVSIQSTSTLTYAAHRPLVPGRYLSPSPTLSRNAKTHAHRGPAKPYKFSTPPLPRPSLDVSALADDLSLLRAAFLKHLSHGKTLAERGWILDPALPPKTYPMRFEDIRKPEVLQVFGFGQSFFFLPA